MVALKALLNLPRPVGHEASIDKNSGAAATSNEEIKMEMKLRSRKAESRRDGRARSEQTSEQRVTWDSIKSLAARKALGMAAWSGERKAKLKVFIIVVEGAKTSQHETIWILGDVLIDFACSINFHALLLIKTIKLYRLRYKNFVSPHKKFS